MPTVLHAHALWKSYVAGVRGCSARVAVLRGVSLAVERGERVLVVGARAAGKTTLLHCLAGLRRPDAGVVERSPAGVTLLDDGEWQPRLDALHAASGALILAARGPVPADLLRVDRTLLLRDGLLVEPGAAWHWRRVAEALPPTRAAPLR